MASHRKGILMIGPMPLEALMSNFTVNPVVEFAVIDQVTRYPSLAVAFTIVGMIVTNGATAKVLP